MEEMAFIDCRFCFLDSAGNFPSNIRGNASKEVEVACVGGFSAESVRLSATGNSTERTNDSRTTPLGELTHANWVTETNH